MAKGTQFDVSRAKGEYEATQARLPNLEADLEVNIFSLSVLLGLSPEALLEEMIVHKVCRMLLTWCQSDYVQIFLRRRPDVQMAERELAASNADIGAETANLFPKFYLTGDMGTQARTFGDLFMASAGMWSFGPTMRWSVFEGGAIRARIDIEKAENQAALAMYEKTVLRSVV